MSWIKFHGSMLSSYHMRHFQGVHVDVEAEALQALVMPVLVAVGAGVPCACVCRLERTISSE